MQSLKKPKKIRKDLSLNFIPKGFPKKKGSPYITPRIDPPHTIAEG